MTNDAIMDAGLELHEAAGGRKPPAKLLELAYEEMLQELFDLALYHPERLYGPLPSSMIVHVPGYKSWDLVEINGSQIDMVSMTQIRSDSPTDTDKGFAIENDRCYFKGYTTSDYYNIVYQKRHTAVSLTAEPPLPNKMHMKLVREFSYRLRESWGGRRLTDTEQYQRRVDLGKIATESAPRTDNTHTGIKPNPIFRYSS